MPKLSDIDIDTSRFRGKGIRPWNDSSVVRPEEVIKANILTKREQNVSKTLVLREQKHILESESVSNELAVHEQCVSNTLAKPLADSLTMREQIASVALANTKTLESTEIVESMVGNERALLNFLFYKCKLIGALETHIITTEELKNVLKIKAEHLRNLIYRMSNKNVIEVSKVKNGKAGWRKFKFSKEIFQHLSLEHSVSNALALCEQSISTALVKPLAEPLAILSSSGSNNSLNTTNHYENKEYEAWKGIDIEPLCHVGFTLTHVLQIASQNKLTPEITQNSIYAFAFDLQKNDKLKNIKGDPINYFMGILRNGKPYNPPSNYESPQDEAMRLYKEKMHEQEQSRAAIEKEAIDLAFKDWFIQLTDEQKIETFPEMLRHSMNSEKLKTSKKVESFAKTHFETNIWPIEKVKIISKQYLQDQIIHDSIVLK